MTREELIEHMKKFVADQDTSRDEWYVSDRRAAAVILTEFARSIDINIDEELFDE